MIDLDALKAQCDAGRLWKPYPVEAPEGTASHLVSLTARVLRLTVGSRSIRCHAWTAQHSSGRAELVMTTPGKLGGAYEEGPILGL